MKLVIVESPAKCSKIQGFLGPEFQVVASMGHIRSLEESLDAIGLTTDFEPRFEFLKEKSKVQKDLKEAAKGKTVVYLAADDDREGEAIAYSVALLLKLNTATNPRIVFHEITKAAIEKAVANPRTLNMDRIWAQQARAMLDMLIGFTLSPILWTQVARGLSAGRCQTPALKLLIEKERAIKSFKSSSSWRITGQWRDAKGVFPATLEDELEDEDSATTYLDLRRTDRKAVVQTNTVRPWSSAPPDPLMTSTLQQQASALFSLSPKATMQIAQKLYEAGHITYMRTDKATLSEEAVTEARAIIEANWGPTYLGPETKVVKEEVKPKGKGKAKSDGKDDEVKAQEAHEAIRPTHMEIETIDSDGLGTKLYGLIRQRALQSVMAKAQGENLKVVFHCEKEAEEDRLPWSSLWKRTTFPGYQIVGRIADLEEDDVAADNDEASAAAWTRALALKAGTTVSWTQLVAQPHETKAEPRYTEATLVRALEKHGIGRPSTFSSLLAAVQDRGYAELKNLPGQSVDLKVYTLADPEKALEVKVSKKVLGAEKQKLVPTDLGLQCLAFLETHFGHLFDYKFTSQMENRLDLVEKGQEAWKQVLRDTWASYKEKYTTMIKAPSKEGANPKLKVFSDGLKAVMSKKGPLLLTEGATKETTVFHGWPAGVLFESMTEELALSFKSSAATKAEGEVMGDWKGEPVIRRTGKFGPYVKVGSVTLSLSPQDTWETIQEKLEGKAAGGSGLLRTFKEYEIRTGPYGPYIYKTTLKTRVFASLPKDIKVDALTEADAATLYKAGLEAKKKKFQKK
jgi:DNA topoisomerase-1